MSAGPDGQRGKDAGIAAVVLAGGASRRFGADNKLLADIDGEPLLRRVVRAFLASRAGRVLVVTGHERDKVEAALAGLDVMLVHNDRHLEGMGTTVAAGAAALPPEVRLAVITPGDLPGLSASLIDRLIAISDAAGEDRIVFPTLPSGEQRNPVLWPRRFFDALCRLGGDQGARALIKQHPEAALPVAMTSDDAFLDIDRPEDLEAWRRQHPVGRGT